MQEAERMSCVRHGRLSAVAIAIAVAGCAAEVDPSEAEQSGPMAITAVDRELQVGDRGPDVEAVFEYLAAYGYFPNSRLEEQYPYWVPLTAELPEDPRYFGPELENAVRIFQGRSGAAPTGVVDFATLEAMQALRCGNPENEFAGMDASEKWDQLDNTPRLPASPRWFTSTCTASTAKCNAIAALGAGPGSANGPETAAFNMWQSETSLSFVRLTPATCADLCIPHIEIKFYSAGAANVPGPGWPALTANSAAKGGWLGSPWQRGAIAVNADTFWNADRLQAVLGHEIGHVMGFDHSAIGPGNPPDGNDLMPLVDGYLDAFGVLHGKGEGSRAVMYFAMPVPETLTLDDRLAAITRYGTWQRMTGLLALDIGVGGPNLSTPIIWAVSTGNRVFKYHEEAWKPAINNDINAAKIAVEMNGTPWIVSTGNQVFRRDNAKHTIGRWGSALGAARDIGIGDSNNNVWIISNTPVAGGGFRVQRWNGASFVDPASPISNGVAIAVDHRGRPVLAMFDGSTWTNSSPDGAGEWTRLSGASPGPALLCATDVAAGIVTGHFMIGCGLGADRPIWNYSKNVADVATQGGTGIKNRNTFVGLDGLAARIAVGPDARPYIVHASGAVFRRVAR
jgi:peptidoglycan hydrolase-like protein with peptidoglycan-binding domain